MQNYPNPLRVGVIHSNSHAIFDRLEFFIPRCQLCKLFIGHIFTRPVFQQKFKISINIQPMCFCHFNHCIDYRAGIRSVHRTAEQPVLPAHCEWTDCILAEIVGKAASSVFQIGLCCITPVENVYYDDNVPLFRGNGYRKSGTMILRVRSRDTALN